MSKTPARTLKPALGKRDELLTAPPVIFIPDVINNPKPKTPNTEAASFCAEAER